MPRQFAPTEVFDLTDDLPEVLALESMTVNELAERYAEVFGEPTRSRNRQHLIRSLAWRIQEKALGGLSAETLARIATLAEEAPRPWRRRLLDAGPRKTSQSKTRAPEPKAPPKPRDPRLPPVGTTLRRVYRGETHEVLVREQDFEYRGGTFPSLSAIARDITGTSWNGFAFFRCSPMATELRRSRELTRGC